jgi:hypothetical protein
VRAFIFPIIPSEVEGPCVLFSFHRVPHVSRLSRRGIPPPRKMEINQESLHAHAGYSNTLSSSFFLPQSAAACTKASTSGCGFFGLEESWG